MITQASRQLVGLPRAARTPLGAEVYEGLTSHPKTLSPWLFYDAEGSRLFEEITRLPEYYLTRTERSILLAHSDEIIAAAAGDHTLTLIELGAGTATKTGLLLEAAVRHQGPVQYQPIDVSATALNEACDRLQAELPDVIVLPRVADYTDGLGAIVAEHAAEGQRRLVLYIGSSIGNFEPADAQQLMRDVRRQIAPGDCVLLGVDLVKPESVLLAAYNDAAGVTAAFNKNVLARINRELDADFDLDQFAHEAVWNARHSRIEMHLRSLVAQRVSIPALELEISFSEGETIHTENSYKYNPLRVIELMQKAGFDLRGHWTDAESLFGVYLGIAA